MRRRLQVRGECDRQGGKLGQRPSSAVAILLAVALGGATAPADDWPQWRGPQRDGVWREDGVMDEFPGERLPWK